MQRCLNGRPTVKFTVWTSARVRVYPTDTVLLTDRFLPSADALVRPCGRGSTWTRACANVARTRVDTRHADSGPRRRG
jgi:hypothetical protein